MAKPSIPVAHKSASMALEGVTVLTDQCPIINQLTLTASSGELVVVLGANGAGKTTLAKALLGLININSGLSTINNVNSHQMSPRERALSIAYLPQSRPLAWPVSVSDTVALGRFAYGVTPGKLQAVDQAKVDQAIVACQLQHLKHRRTDSLSGGELARVHCARAFASEAPLLIADEPIAALDPRHQYLIMQLIRDYVDAGGGAMVILHDPAIAARFADRLIWLQAGEVVADGPADKTLTAARLLEVYGVEAQVGVEQGTVHVTMIGPAALPPR